MKSMRNLLLPKSVLTYSNRLWRRFVFLFFLFFFSLTLVACKKTSDQGDSAATPPTTPTGNGKAVTFKITVTSLIRHLNLNMGERFIPDQILRGSIYVLNTDDYTDATYNWTAYLDESDFSTQSNKTLNLAPGNYEFSLLLTSGTRQYAGNAVETITPGENEVVMTITPVIGDTLTDITLVDQIFDLKIQYDPTELEGIASPQLGVLIDSDPTENLLTIDQVTGQTTAYISLERGTHNLKVKFYEGSTQIGSSKPSQETLEIALGNDYTIDIVPFQGETTFSLTGDGGEADFTFLIPSEIVEEAGDVSNLQALFSIVGPINPLREATLTLDPSGDAYYGVTSLTDYHYDRVDFILTFQRISDSKQFGECINEGVVLDLNTRAVDCGISLRRDGVIGGNLLATLRVNVMNTNGGPVAGASVYVDESLVGITGSETFGTPGSLKTFGT